MKKNIGNPESAWSEETKQSRRVVKKNGRNGKQKLKESKQ